MKARIQKQFDELLAGDFPPMAQVPNLQLAGPEKSAEIPPLEVTGAKGKHRFIVGNPGTGKSPIFHGLVQAELLRRASFLGNDIEDRRESLLVSCPGDFVRAD